MADIRIEEKASPSIWPWILGLLLLALVGWGLVEVFGDDDDDMVAESTEMVDESESEARGSEIVNSGATYSLIDFDDPQAGERFGDLVNDYSVYTADLTGEMGLDHEFSHNALTQLANATVALAASHGMTSDLNVREKAQTIKEKAEAITRDPYAVTHADDIRAAATSIAEILGEIQTKHYPGLEDAVAEVSRSASEINPQTLTLDQKEDVRTFFGNARVALEAMREKQTN